MKRILKNRLWCILGVLFSIFSLLLFLAVFLLDLFKFWEYQSEAFLGFFVWSLINALIGLVFYSVDIFVGKSDSDLRITKVFNIILPILIFLGYPMLYCFCGAIFFEVFIWVAYHLVLLSLTIMDLLFDAKAIRHGAVIAEDN